jgi:hypothetical protein
MYTVYLFAVIGVYVGLVSAWGGRPWEILFRQFVGAYFGILNGVLVAMSLSAATQ